MSFIGWVAIGLVAIAFLAIGLVAIAWVAIGFLTIGLIAIDWVANGFLTIGLLAIGRGFSDLVVLVAVAELESAANIAAGENVRTASHATASGPLKRAMRRLFSVMHRPVESIILLFQRSARPMRITTPLEAIPETREALENVA